MKTACAIHSAIPFFWPSGSARSRLRCCPLIGYYINDVEAVGGAEDTLKAGMGYVRIMLFGLFPFAMSQAYAGTLRVTGETKLPMAASVTSVLVNLVGNYILIFGHLGAPALGARGAAVATVISRYVEMLIIVVVAHRRVDCL